MRKNKGFTLIELLVVIAIIGILAILIFLALQKAQAAARDSQRKAFVRDIATAEAMYYDTEKKYGPLTGSDNSLKSKGLIEKFPSVCPNGADESCDPNDIEGAWNGRVKEKSDDGVGCTGTPFARKFCVWTTLERDPSKGFRCTEAGCEDTP